MPLQRITEDYRGLHVITGDYSALQEMQDVTIEQDYKSRLDQVEQGFVV